jgi:hypothetical protein
MLYVACPVYFGNNVSRIATFQKHIENVEKFYSLDDLYFLFFIEPDSEPMIEIIESTFKCNFHIFKNPFKYGICLNYYYLFHYCFENLKLETVFFLEDDVICSQDSPNIIKWATENNLLDEYLLCLLNKHYLFNKNHTVYKNCQNTDILKLKDVNYLSAWGSGIGKGIWQKYLKPTWSMVNTYDCVLTKNFTEIPILSPAINRLNHIGRTGTHCTEQLYISHGFDEISIYNCFNKIDNYNLVDVI